MSFIRKLFGRERSLEDLSGKQETVKTPLDKSVEDVSLSALSRLSKENVPPAQAGEVSDLDKLIYDPANAPDQRQYEDLLKGVIEDALSDRSNRQFLVDVERQNMILHDRGETFNVSELFRNDQFNEQNIEPIVLANLQQGGLNATASILVVVLKQKAADTEEFTVEQGFGTVELTVERDQEGAIKALRGHTKLPITVKFEDARPSRQISIESQYRVEIDSDQGFSVHQESLAYKPA